MLLGGALLFALLVSRGWGDGTSEYQGTDAARYNEIVPTDGNLQAILARNDQMAYLIQNGITPAQVMNFSAHPVHPVEAIGRDAKDPSVMIIDAIPMSPGPSAPTVQAPTDILTHVDPNLRRYFKGYANLGVQTGDGTIGLTTDQGNQVSYQLDNRFLKSSDVQLSPTTPVLTIGLEGETEQRKVQAESYLHSLRQALLQSVSTSMPLAAILMSLGALAVAALKRKQFTAQYEVVEMPLSENTDVETVEVHEQQHVEDDIHINDGSSPILPEYLDPASPFYALAKSLMEVRAGLAEILSGGEVNVPYLAINTADLAAALQAVQILLVIQAPALFAMAQQDLAYAQSWLQQHNSEFINF